MRSDQTSRSSTGLLHRGCSCSGAHPRRALIRPRAVPDGSRNWRPMGRCRRQTQTSRRSSRWEEPCAWTRESAQIWSPAVSGQRAWSGGWGCSPRSRARHGMHRWASAYGIHQDPCSAARDRRAWNAAASPVGLCLRLALSGSYAASVSSMVFLSRCWRIAAASSLKSSETIPERASRDSCCLLHALRAHHQRWSSVMASTRAKAGPSPASSDCRRAAGRAAAWTPAPGSWCRGPGRALPRAWSSVLLHWGCRWCRPSWSQTAQQSLWSLAGCSAAQGMFCERLTSTAVSSRWRGWSGAHAQARTPPWPRRIPESVGTSWLPSRWPEQHSPCSFADPACTGSASYCGWATKLSSTLHSGGPWASV